MELILATLNAKYIHSAFGLRYLRANLGPFREQSILREFTISDRPVDIVESLLAGRPRFIGLGVYIWNARETLAVVRLLKQLAPEVVVILGGPEVSHEAETQEVVALADHVITGEGETALPAVLTALDAERPVPKIVPGGLPELARLRLPYDEYTDEDLKHRVLYLEASRGCPFSCEFCLSSLDTKVRTFPLDAFLEALDGLISRGARQLKFVDRTFNLSPRVSLTILDFLLARQHLGLFAHFELVPDRLPESLRERIARFPRGALQLEVGIQTLDAATSVRISRPTNVPAIEANLSWLREHSGAHVHADLIVGLPGEDIESFALGFDRLVGLSPGEIQVGILKRLRGTPIVRHDTEFAVVWSSEPPYEILENARIDFARMQRLKRFARVWDLVANRGNFPLTLPMLWEGSSPFQEMMRFTDWLSARVSLGGVALRRLAELLLAYLTEVRGRPIDEVGNALARDFGLPGRRMPGFLQPYGQAQTSASPPARGALPPRQQRHHR